MVFENASNFNIEGSHFNQANSINYTVYQELAKTDPLGLLLRNTALEATHKSSTSAYAPKCKRGTRQQVINDILDWVSQDNPSKPILWFSGPAGGGKTCIQHEIVAITQERGELAASYFFSTRVQGLDHEKPFIATIAHQLTDSIPGLKPYIQEQIKEKPQVFLNSLDEQVEILISNPLKSFVSSTRRIAKLPRVIIIDGFDECRDVNQRRHLLQILHALTSIPDFPFRVILASRPEFDIRTAFGREPLRRITTHIFLADYNGDHDVRHYLCDEFARIRDEHPSKNVIPPYWPQEDDIEVLVSKASSQFIFASTVIKYIENPRQNPILSLRAVLSSTIQNPSRNPFAELDALYHLILHPHETDPILLRRLLHALLYTVGIDAVSGKTHSHSLDDFFDLHPGTVDIMFCDLHAILSFSKNDGGGITFYHKSLGDYLTSEARSGDMYQFKSMDIALQSVHHLQKWHPSNLQGYERRKWVFDYASSGWPIWMRDLLQGPSAAELPPKLLQFHPAHIYQVLHVEDWGITHVINDDIKDLQETLHRVKCNTNNGCLQLCQRLSYIRQHNEQIKEVTMSVSKLTRDAEARSKRIVLLRTLNPFLSASPYTFYDPAATSQAQANCDLKSLGSSIFIKGGRQQQGGRSPISGDDVNPLASSTAQRNALEWDNRTNSRFFPIADRNPQQSGRTHTTDEYVRKRSWNLWKLWRRITCS